MTSREVVEGVAGPTDGSAAGMDRGGTSPHRSAVIERCVRETEALFLSGSHHCAEAVIAVIREHFSPKTPEAVVGLVSGLGGGSGVGCICGALSAATITLAMVLPDDKESVVQLTQHIHQWFKEEYGAACCRALQDTEHQGCRVNPGAVAGRIAELLLDLEKGRL